MSVKDKAKRKGDGDKDVLKDLGKFIEDHFKKGLNKVEEIFKDTEAADDKLFSYFKAFVDDKGVASVTPSSKFLVDRVLKALDVKNAKAVIEYGPAGGVMTRRVLELLPPDGRLLAVELNDKLFDELQKTIKDPRFVPVRGDVREIKKIAAENGFKDADLIFSGIPFAFLSSRGRHELLKDTHDLLKPSGRFVAYQVTTHLIPLLEQYFRKVKTQFELRNLPPHFVFACFK